MKIVKVTKISELSKILRLWYYLSRYATQTACIFMQPTWAFPLNELVLRFQDSIAFKPLSSLITIKSDHWNHALIYSARFIVSGFETCSLLLQIPVLFPVLLVDAVVTAVATALQLTGDTCSVLFSLVEVIFPCFVTTSRSRRLSNHLLRSLVSASSWTTLFMSSPPRVVSLLSHSPSKLFLVITITSIQVYECLLNISKTPCRYASSISANISNNASPTRSRVTWPWGGGFKNNDNEKSSKRGKIRTSNK